MCWLIRVAPYVPSSQIELATPSLWLQERLREELKPPHTGPVLPRGPLLQRPGFGDAIPTGMSKAAVYR